MPTHDYQRRVDRWMMDCFGFAISADHIERNHRLLEEALEAVQSGGCTASEAHQLVDYVFNRPVGEIDDAEEPGHMIIQLDDGRVVLSTECMYSPLPATCN